MSASIGTATEKSSEESNEDIEKLREILEMIPGMDSKSVDEIINNFKMIRAISIETEELENGVCVLFEIVQAFGKLFKVCFTYRFTS